ncbi:MAG: hypothetical protein AAGA77_20355 [Bacteroidota bacterium]
MRIISVCFLTVIVSLSGCKDFVFGSGKSAKESAELIKTFSVGRYIFKLNYNETVDTTFLDLWLDEAIVSAKNYKGKVTKHFVEDLNQDQKKEVYFVASNLKGKNLYAFQLYGEHFDSIPIGDKRMIAYAEPSTYKIERKQFVEIYTFTTEDGALKKGQSRYNLVEKENGRVLLPQGWQPREMENLLGQYDLENKTEKDTKKTLLIGARDGGKYNVQIDVTNISNARKLCQFKALGEFIDRDLYVPLNSIDPELKGELKIIFLGATAIVYTADKNDYLELSSFCSGKGSIAGSFQKLKLEDE